MQICDWNINVETYNTETNAVVPLSFQKAFQADNVDTILTVNKTLLYTVRLNDFDTSLIINFYIMNNLHLFSTKQQQ